MGYYSTVFRAIPKTQSSKKTALLRFIPKMNEKNEPEGVRPIVNMRPL